jgi:CHAT domain-containing protein/tetratricopeptide (TPR) repeat protein
MAAPAYAWPAEEEQDQTLLEMRKRVDAMDEAKDPAAYREAWIEVLEYARRLYPADSPELAQIEGEQVVADYFQGDVKGALERARKTAAVLETAGPDWEDDWIDYANAIVVFNMALGRHGEAIGAAKKVLDYRIAHESNAPTTKLATAYSNYAHALFEFGNYDEAIANSRRAIDTALGLDPMPPEPLNFFSNLGTYLFTAGRLDEAIEEARKTQAVLDARLPEIHPYKAVNWNLIAVTLADLGRLDEAEAASRRAVDIAQAVFGESERSYQYLTTLAGLLLRGGKAEEALALSEQARIALDKALGSASNRALLAREHHARALAMLGREDEALAEMRQLAQLRADNLPPHHRDRIDGAERLARVALDAGQLALARSSQAEAQALREAVLPEGTIDHAVGEARLGAIEARLGNATGGLARALAAASALDARLAQLESGGIRRSGRDREIRAGYRWALDAALSAGDAEAGFALAQAALENSAGRAARETALRDTTGDPQLAELLRRRQDMAVQLEAVLDRQLRLAGRGAPQDEQGVEAERRKLLESALATIDSELGALAPELTAGEADFRLTLVNARAALGRDEALLLVAAGEARSGLFAVTRDEAVMLPLEAGAAELAGLVGAVREGLTPTATLDAGAFDFEASAQLHALLFPEQVRKLVQGKHRLLVAANGALSALPFAVLAPARDKQVPSLTDADWLIRHHSLVTLTSVDALTGRPARSGERSIGGFVALGAPQLSGEGGSARAFRSANLARQVRDLPALPATGAELAQLGEALAASKRTILTGGEATEAGLRALDLGDADVLAFATHGLLAGEIEGLEEPALVVTPSGEDDGLLTASEIMRLRLDSDWVLLSACNTAAGSGVDASGLAGLARAFLHAGGRNLLASHWAVRDDAAAALSVGTVRRYAAGEDPAEALRAAMLEVMEGKQVPGGEHPLLWAPFVFVGR